MTQELKQTIKFKLAKLHNIFNRLVREKDDHKELPQIKQTVEDFLKRIESIIYISSLQHKKAQLMEENKESQADNIVSVINSAQNQLLSNLSPLALFKNHPNLMPIVQRNEKITRFSLNKQNLNSKNTSVKVKVDVLLQQASRIKNTIPSDGTINLEGCNPIYSISYQNSILNNDFNDQYQCKNEQKNLRSLLDKETRLRQGDKSQSGQHNTIHLSDILLINQFLHFILGQLQAPIIGKQFIQKQYDSRNKPKIQKSCYIKCVACKKGMLDSQIVSIFYKLQGNQHQAVSTKDIYSKRAGEAKNSENYVIRPSGPRGRSSKLDLGLSMHTPSLGEGTPAQTPGVYSSYKAPNTPGASSSYYQPNLRRQSSASARSHNNYQDDQDDEINI